MRIFLGKEQEKKLSQKWLFGFFEENMINYSLHKKRLPPYLQIVMHIIHRVIHIAQHIGLAQL
jgi:hypothetical protein